MNQINMPFIRTYPVQKHIVSFSGGIGSWMTAKHVAAEHGPDTST